MRKIRFRLRLKIYPVIWSIITLAAVYILLRFAILSFSEDMGQAGFGEALVAKLCSQVIESGSSFVSYAASSGESSYSFPVKLVDNELALGAFTKEDTQSTVVLAKEASYFQSDYAKQLEDNSLTTQKSNSVTTQESNGATTQENNSTTKENNSVTAQESSTGTYGSLGIYPIDSNVVGLEYILTNGAILRSVSAGVLLGDEKIIANQLQIGYLKGDISQKESEGENNDDSAVAALGTGGTVKYTLSQLKDTSFLVRNFYIVDASTEVTESLFNAEDFLSKDMKMKQTNDAPQILIYHTHSQEAFIDSRPGNEDDTVIGIGSYLTKILQDDYGYNVIHDKTKYDIVNGKEDRNLAYNQAEDGVTKILKDNPTIEVIIDLHRNSGAGKTVNINGRDTAMVMLFNGLSRDQNGPITYLDNPYLPDNLAFSFQLQLKSKELYPGLFYKNYLKSYRFNMHLRPKSLLIELGTVNNTVEAEKNAIIPFAEILNDVLKGN
ncbi:MAG TPA: stage II sporulation protein P [Mobilitalea sp.]|nr:stage II sporulation protein P [Mobilitalea sp.]